MPCIFHGMSGPTSGSDCSQVLDLEPFDRACNAIGVGRMHVVCDSVYAVAFCQTAVRVLVLADATVAHRPRVRERRHRGEPLRWDAAAGRPSAGGADVALAAPSADAGHAAAIGPALADPAGCVALGGARQRDADAHPAVLARAQALMDRRHVERCDGHAWRVHRLLAAAASGTVAQNASPGMLGMSCCMPPCMPGTPLTVAPCIAPCMAWCMYG